MTYLLDTHVFLWRLLEPHRLSEEQARALEDRAHEFYLSAVSIWEVLVLARKGRLELRPDPQTFLRRALTDSPLRIAPIDLEIAMRSEALEGFDNQDPADKFIVATSLVNNHCLLTSDARMRSYEPVRTL
jgi:PIN domain nuclease of toxin-antitoxin system